MIPKARRFAFERAQVAALVSAAEQELVDVDRAVTRVRSGIHDRCESCGGEVPEARLLPAPRRGRESAAPARAPREVDDPDAASPAAGPTGSRPTNATAMRGTALSAYRTKSRLRFIAGSVCQQPR